MTPFGYGITILENASKPMWVTRMKSIAASAGFQSLVESGLSVVQKTG